MTGLSTRDDSIAMLDAWYREVERGVRILNSTAPHQQDLLQSDRGVARALAASHHGASSHLTKTIVRIRNTWRCYA